MATTYYRNGRQFYKKADSYTVKIQFAEDDTKFIHVGTTSDSVSGLDTITEALWLGVTDQVTNAFVGVPPQYPPSPRE